MIEKNLISRIVFHVFHAYVACNILQLYIRYMGNARLDLNETVVGEHVESHNYKTCIHNTMHPSIGVKS